MKQRNFTEMLLPWWGYLHTSGTLHVKRYFDALDIEEALESPFCEIVEGPFHATNRDAALEILKAKLAQTDTDKNIVEP